MGTDFLIIIAGTGIALCLIGIGIMKTREQARQSQIFLPGNEWYASAYIGAIAQLEREMDVWVKK